MSASKRDTSYNLISEPRRVVPVPLWNTARGLSSQNGKPILRAVRKEGTPACGRCVRV